MEDIEQKLLEEARNLSNWAFGRDLATRDFQLPAEIRAQVSSFNIFEIQEGYRSIESMAHDNHYSPHLEDSISRAARMKSAGIFDAIRGSVAHSKSCHHYMDGFSYAHNTLGNIF
jgi:hypothetical protein